MKTALYENHQREGAKFFTFAGFEMPLQYKGVLQEYNAVRHHVGLFDVSHMGRIDISGKDTLKFLDFLSTNTILNKPVDHAVYTVLCNEEGFSLDDVLIYLLNETSAFIVANASNREKDLEHIRNVALGYEVEVKDRFNDTGILALQGPKSGEILHSLFPKVPPLNPLQVYPQKNLILSRTGYTGEEGYEFFGSHEEIKDLWEKFLNLGAQPCGLAVRDVLRLEMGYALYGHELSEKISPLESVASWTVKLNEHDFLGKKGLSSFEHKQFPVGLIGKEGAIAREGAPIYLSQKEIGKVTSGTFSPTLQKPIALGLIDQKLPLHSEVFVEIRKSLHPFEVVKWPFLPKKH